MEIVEEEEEEEFEEDEEESHDGEESQAMENCFQAMVDILAKQVILSNYFLYINPGVNKYPQHLLN